MACACILFLLFCAYLTTASEAWPMVTCVCDAAGHELGRLSCGGAGGKRGSDPAYLPPYLAAHLGEDLAQIDPTRLMYMVCACIFCCLFVCIG